MAAPLVLRNPGTTLIRLSDSLPAGSGAGTALFPGRSAAVKKRRASKAMTKQG